MIAVPLAVGLVMQEQRKQDDDGDRNTDQPKQQSFTETHCLSSFRMWQNNEVGSVSVPCEGSQAQAELFEARIV
jgi:hypothetical protein